MGIPCQEPRYYFSETKDKGKAKFFMTQRLADSEKRKRKNKAFFNPKYDGAYGLYHFYLSKLLGSINSLFA